MGIVIETDCHHDRLTQYLAPICQRYDKLITLTRDRRNVRLIDVRHGPLLEPEAIVDEHLDRYGIAVLVLRVLEEALKPIALTRIAEDGRPRLRPQQQAFLHVV